jgi:predicted deacylase
MFSKNEDWLVSPSSGILSTEVTLGQKIQLGEKIGKLSDPFSGEDGTIIKSNLDGIVVGVNRSPLIQEGESIFKITSFIDNKKAEDSLEKWDDFQSDTLE